MQCTHTSPKSALLIDKRRAEDLADQVSPGSHEEEEKTDLEKAEQRGSHQYTLPKQYRDSVILSKTNQAHNVVVEEDNSRKFQPLTEQFMQIPGGIEAHSTQRE